MEQNPDFVAARVIESSSIENFVGKISGTEEKRDPTEDIAPANTAVRYRWKTYKDRENSEVDYREEKGLQEVQSESSNQDPVLPAEKKNAEFRDPLLLEESVETYDVQYNALQKMDKSRDSYVVKKGEISKKNKFPYQVAPNIKNKKKEEEKNSSEEDDEFQTTSLPYRTLINPKKDWRKVTKEIPLPQVMSKRQNNKDVGSQEPHPKPQEFLPVPNLPLYPDKGPIVPKEEEKVEISPPIQNLVASEPSAEQLPIGNEIPIGKKPSTKKLWARSKQVSEEAPHRNLKKDNENIQMQSNPLNAQYSMYNNLHSPLLMKPRSKKLGLIENQIGEDPIDKIGSWFENIELIEKLKKLGVETEELKKHFAGARLVFSRNERGLEGVISLAFLEQTLIGNSNSSLRSRLLHS